MIGAVKWKTISTFKKQTNTSKFKIIRIGHQAICDTLFNVNNLLVLVGDKELEVLTDIKEKM